MPIYVCSNDRIDEYLPKGIGIGLSSSKMFDKNLEEISIILKTNSHCLLFTDGLNELQNDQGEEFGYEKLKLILENTVLKNSNIIENLKKEISQFTGNIDPFDDITLFSFRYIGEDRKKEEEYS
jgi:sigma-B regulation protein RsbU (phosphoserine phosphatase)